MSSFSMDARSMSSLPLVNSQVKNCLFKTAPDIDEPPFQFIHTGFVCSRNDAAWQHWSRNPQDWDMGCLEARGWMPESVAYTAVQLLHVRGTVCTVLLPAPAASCWNTKSLLNTAYRWQQYDVIMTSWSSIEEVSKRYHQNFLLCNKNEITACIANLCNSFCEEVMRLHFSR